MSLFDRLRRTDRNPREAPSGDGVATPESEALRLIGEGNTLEDKGALREALARYDEAIRVGPTLARAHLNRGNALLALGEHGGAAEAYATALNHEPDYAPAHFNLGNAQLCLNRREDARASYLQALAFKPDFSDAWVALGALYQDLGQREEAAASYRRALEIQPGQAAVHVNLGNVLQDHGFFEEAIASYRHALKINPQLAMAHFGAGNAQQALGRYNDAVTSYRQVLQSLPNFAPAHGNLGNALQTLGRHEEASASYRRVLQIVPNLGKAHFDLGNALCSLGRFQEAIASCREALRLDPDHVDAHCLLGNLLTESERFVEAFAHYRRALEMAPENADVHCHIGYAYRWLGDLDNARASYQSALKFAPDSALALRNLIFIENSLASEPAGVLLAKARQFGKLATQMARPFLTWSNSMSPDRALKVGLVSGDFRDHAVGRFLESVLAAVAARRTSKLKLHAYSSHIFFDDVSTRIKASCREWVLAANMTDEALARRIRDDGIDILIDLSGYSAFNRLQMFAWKPAPIQVTWLGYLATTGLDAIDYVIADAWTLPESEENSFTEKVWRLPDSYVCFTSPAEATEPGPLPAQRNGYVTFGSFNNLAKMNDAVVALWARVLAAVPDSRLFLKSRQFAESAVRQRVIGRFAGHGVDSGRLMLEGLVPRAEYLKPYQRMDIALDPFPYPGITTSVESLFMGVPILTLAGKTFLSRQGVGLLMNAGLADWIATDADDFVARAAAHAGDLPRLAALRQGLRQQVLASPIFDAARFADNFEAALRGMWLRWCGHADGSQRNELPGSISPR